MVQHVSQFDHFIFAVDAEVRLCVCIYDPNVVRVLPCSRQRSEETRPHRRRSQRDADEERYK
jgi:hypothetical protein